MWNSVTNHNAMRKQKPKRQRYRTEALTGKCDAVLQSEKIIRQPGQQIAGRNTACPVKYRCNVLTWLVLAWVLRANLITNLKKSSSIQLAAEMGFLSRSTSERKWQRRCTLGRTLKSRYKHHPSNFTRRRRYVSTNKWPTTLTCSISSGFKNKDVDLLSDRTPKKFWAAQTAVLSIGSTFRWSV